MATDLGVQDELEDEMDDHVDGDDGTDEQPPVTIEAEARAMGWHPLAEFRGDPRRWVPAEEFVRKGRDELPVLRDQNRRMAERLARQEPMLAEIPALKETVTSMNQALADMRDLARKADDRGYQRALAELNAEREAAVEAGDTATFRQVDAQVKALETERAAVTAAPASPPPPPAPAAKPAIEPEIQAFINDNVGWWGVNQPLTQAMVNAHATVKIKYPTMPLSDQLAEAKRRLAADFPESFPEDAAEPAEEPAPMPAARTPARAGAPVARPSPAIPPRRPADPWEAAIPDPADRAEAQAAFKNMKRHQEDLTVGEYLALYADPKADVLALRRAARTK